MSIELWAGLECTVNRVGSAYYDQIEFSGHQHRLDDLNLFAELGIKRLRYPILWERTVPEGVADWRWADERLGRLQELRLVPIVGLLHHGSGPRCTSLIDPLFPQKFSQYAREAAQRYPWIENYTPINEPLTTARFSGLYGHWYPHARDNRMFARALLAQCKAIVLAMHEIRKVNSKASLVQTEDLGKSFSVRKLKYQADFENERRWLTFDLLCGWVNRYHSMWSFFIKFGIPERELSWFCEHPCPPDLFGMNHYVTSERFLDDRLDEYPQWLRGGNGQDSYADVEAVRVSRLETLGPEARLNEMWARYHRPIAVTEVHLGCTIDEQLRWFWEVWSAAASAHQRGAEIKAVTAWALLGSFDWNSLVTKPTGYYEAGIFDILCARPRPTSLVTMLQDIAQGRTPNHPALEKKGWWRRPERTRYSNRKAPPEVCAV